MPLKIRKLDADGLREQLAELECKHSMSSPEFYERFRAGKLDDRIEFVHWAGLCYLALEEGILTLPPGSI